MNTSTTSPSLFPLLSGKNGDQVIEFTKSMPRKNNIKFIKRINSESDKPLVLQKNSSETDQVIEDLNQTLFNHSLLRINNKVKSFINRLRRIANLNSRAPSPPLFINDLAFFSSTSNDLHDKPRPEGIRSFFVVNELCWFAGCLKSRFFKAFSSLKLTPFHPFERTKISWDIFLFLNTLLLFFYVPLTLSFQFLDDQSRLMFGRLQFAIYLLDMVINMNTAYIDNGVLIKERFKSFRNYMRTFFIWDLLTVISVAGKNDFLMDGHDESNNKLFFIQLLFFTKFKMFQVRFNNIKEIFCLGTRLKGIFDLFVLFITTFLFAHFFACMFHLIGINSVLDRNWLSNYAIDAKSTQDQYLYSLYWSTVTMMTVGYGDIVPQNGLEMIFSVLTIFMGCIVVGYNINKIGNIFHDMNKESRKIQENISKMNKFMESKKINGNLQMRIRAYLKFVWEKHNEKMNSELQGIIECLSDPLKEELYLEGYGDVIRNFSMLSNNFCDEFLSSLIKYMEEQTYMKNDLIFEEHDISKHNLYFIKSGEVELFRLLHENHTPIIFKRVKEKDCFGEHSFLTGLKNTFSARACSYTQVYKISRENFLACLSKFPKDYEKYCEIRDRLIFSKSYQLFNIRCIICGRKDHLNDNCSLMHFIPNKEVIILRHLYSASQERVQKKRRDLRVHALKHRLRIYNKHVVFNSRFRRLANVSESSSDQESGSSSSDSSRFQPQMSISNERNTILIPEKAKKSVHINLSLQKQRTLKKKSAKLSDLNKKTLAFSDSMGSGENGLTVISEKMSISGKGNFQIPHEGRQNGADQPSPFFRSSAYGGSRVLRKDSNQVAISGDIEFDIAHSFMNYFPEDAPRNFIMKYEKMRTNLKKAFKKKEKKALSEASSPKKKGYFLMDKSVNFGKNSREIDKMNGSQSDPDTTKKNRNNNFFDNFRLSPSYSFFKKKEVKPTCFLEVVNEVKEQKHNKKSAWK